MIENPHYDISVDKGDPGPAGTFTTPTADVSFGNHRITNLGDATEGGDAVNKNYADSRYIRAGERINMGSERITHLHDPADNHDALNRRYADGRYLRNGQNINLGSLWITSSYIPAADNDLVIKKYVDKYKPPLKTASYATNISLEKDSTSVISFNAGFLSVNPRDVYFIWFSLRYSSDTYPRIVLHPFIVGSNKEVVGQVDATDYIIYYHDTQNIYIKRGDNSSTLIEIGILYSS